MADLTELPIAPCCDAALAASCCEPSEKDDCCGAPTEPVRCGCQAGGVDGDEE